jgi:anti-anti-sigma factor
VAGLDITVTQHDGGGGPFTLVRLVGEADHTTGEMADVLGAEAAKLPRLLVIEMSGLLFLDTYALSLVYRAARVLGRAGCALALVSPSDHVAQVLRLTGTDQVVPVCGSVDEASVLRAAACCSQPCSPWMADNAGAGRTSRDARAAIAGDPGASGARAAPRRAHQGLHRARPPPHRGTARTARPHVGRPGPADQHVPLRGPCLLRHAPGDGEPLRMARAQPR